jgi:hypothetical protein
MTDKEIVLAKWPDAVAWENFYRFNDAWRIWECAINGGGELLGHGDTEELAWADAARRIESGIA